MYSKAWRDGSLVINIYNIGYNYSCHTKDLHIQCVPLITELYPTHTHTHRFGGGEFSLPGNLAISIQQLLHAVDCACAESEADRSSGERREEALVKQDHLMDCIMLFVTRLRSHCQVSMSNHLRMLLN